MSFLFSVLQLSCVDGSLSPSISKVLEPAGILHLAPNPGSHSAEAVLFILLSPRDDFSPEPFFTSLSKAVLPISLLCLIVL